MLAWLLAIALVTPALPKSGADNGAATSVRASIEAALAAGDADAALDAILAAKSELSPSDVHRLSARAYLLAERWRDARRALAEAIALDPTDASLRLSMAEVSNAIDLHAAAIAECERALWLGLDTPELHRAWAIGCAGTGALLGTLREVRAAAPLEVGQRCTDGIVIRVSDRAGRGIAAGSDSAIYHASLVLESNPSDVDALLVSAAAWQHARQGTLAEQSLRQALSAASPKKRPRCLRYLGELCLTSGRIEEFFACLREMMKHSPSISAAEVAAAYERVAEAVAERGDLNRQIRYLRLAVELERTAPRLIALGDALRLAGRSDEAVQFWRQVEEDPRAAERLRTSENRPPASNDAGR
ncbi:MAG: hypothetical protein L6Q92_01430 [Phycisphaerae bacterium]|nr:hypothetical protein [Phycisphaerae bacterium]